MNHDPFNDVERQIAAAGVAGSPVDLRGKVLADVQRELRAARWDRRFARAAIVLLAAGIGLNLAVSRGWSVGQRDAMNRLAASHNQEALTQTAEAIAEATDSDTGRRLTLRLAAMSGRELSLEEKAAIGAAVERRATHVTLPGKKG